MNSTTSIVAGDYRLQQWMEEIQGCQNRSPGNSIKEWCSQHDLTVANYYYRLGQVRKDCLQNVPEKTITQSIVPVSPNLISYNTNATVEISVGKFQILISDTTSPELQKMV